MTNEEVIRHFCYGADARNKRGTLISENRSLISFGLTIGRIPMGEYVPEVLLLTDEHVARYGISRFTVSTVNKMREYYRCDFVEPVWNKRTGRLDFPSNVKEIRIGTTMLLTMPDAL